MSAPYRVLLYYNYTPVENPQQLCNDIRTFCEEHGLLGRILIGEEGMNGTVAGTPEATEAYKQFLWSDERFADTSFKEDASDFIPFKKLKVKVRDEIVTLGTKVDLRETGVHLSPQQWHEMAQQDDVVILDARNEFESRIGKFKNAITPNIDYFRDLPKWLEENRAQIEGKKVLMYCTGGIRCVPSSVLVRHAGAQEVYQLDGGIVEYGKAIPDGLWEGSLYVFDERTHVQVNDDEHHTIISTCNFCDTKTDVYYNCCNAECNELLLLCEHCKERSNAACSQECSTKHRDGVVKHWDIKLKQAT